MENQLLSENKFLKRRLSFLSLVLNNIVDNDTRYKINQMLSTMEELSDNDNSIHCLRLKYVYSSDLTKRDGLDKTNIG